MFVATLLAALALTTGPPPTVSRAIHLSATIYGVPYAEAVSVASCETGGSFSPFALNRSSGAAGLFQFLASTWKRTPFREFSRFDPFASALAAGWLWRSDGGSWREWTCRP